MISNAQSAATAERPVARAAVDGTTIRLEVAAAPSHGETCWRRRHLRIESLRLSATAAFELAQRSCRDMWPEACSGSMVLVALAALDGALATPRAADRMRSGSTVTR